MYTRPNQVEDVLALQFSPLCKRDATPAHISHVLNALYILLWDKQEIYPKLFVRNRDTKRLQMNRDAAQAVIDNYRISEQVADTPLPPEISKALVQKVENMPSISYGTLIDVLGCFSAFEDNIRNPARGLKFSFWNKLFVWLRLYLLKRTLREYFPS